MKNKRLNIILAPVFTYIISFLIIALLSMHLGLLSILANCVSLLSWWALLYQELNLAN
ncbi:MAG: hypothetical protein QXZ41_05040 [Ignisphaera sp.]